MLIRKKGTKKPKPADKPRPAYNPELGSGWTPGQDGSHLLPDWTRRPLETGADGVTRPVRN